MAGILPCRGPCEIFFPPPRSRSRQLVAQALEARFVQMPTIGCFDRDVLRRAADMRDDERMDAAGALVGEGAGVRRMLCGCGRDFWWRSRILTSSPALRAQGEARSIWVRYRALEEKLIGWRAGVRTRKRRQ